MSLENGSGIEMVIQMEREKIMRVLSDRGYEKVGEERGTALKYEPTSQGGWTRRVVMFPDWNKFIPPYEGAQRMLVYRYMCSKYPNWKLEPMSVRDKVLEMVWGEDELMKAIKKTSYVDPVEIPTKIHKYAGNDINLSYLINSGLVVTDDGSQLDVPRLKGRPGLVDLKTEMLRLLGEFIENENGFKVEKTVADYFRENPMNGVGFREVRRRD